MSNRYIYFDVMRVIAAFAVIVLHVSAWCFYDVKVDSFSWKVFNFYNGIVRWAVPVFIMISGALFLNSQKDVDIKKLYSKNILRIVCALVFWSLAYAAASMFFGDNHRGDIKIFAKSFIAAPSHMGFLFIIIGLYILIPVLKQIAKSDTIYKYLLIVTFVASFIVPNFLLLFSSLSGDVAELASDFFNVLDKSVNQGFGGGPVFYFLLGGVYS